MTPQETMSAAHVDYHVAVTVVVGGKVTAAAQTNEVQIS